MPYLLSSLSLSSTKGGLTLVSTQKKEKKKDRESMKDRERDSERETAEGAEG